MSDVFQPYTPPSVGVPGPFKPPPMPTKYMRPARQPSWRVITVPEDSTLSSIAMRYYRNPMDALRIFNNNQSGKRMPDGSDGALFTPNDVVTTGTKLWLD